MIRSPILGRNLALVCFSLSLLFSGFSHGASSVEFHGNLIAGSCSPHAVNVDFNEVTLSDIISATTSPALPNNGNTAVKTFSLDIDCTSHTTVQYRFNGNPSSFNPYAFETDAKWLGVVIADTQGTGSTIAPGVWKTLSNVSGGHALVAFLVRNPTATTNGGDFASSATIEVQIP